MVSCLSLVHDTLRIDDGTREASPEVTSNSTSQYTRYKSHLHELILVMPFFVTTSAAAGDAPAAAPAAKAAKPVEEEVDALDGGKNSLISTA